MTCHTRRPFSIPYSLYPSSWSTTWWQNRCRFCYATNPNQLASSTDLLPNDQWQRKIDQQVKRCKDNALEESSINALLDGSMQTFSTGLPLDMARRLSLKAMLKTKRTIQGFCLSFATMPDCIRSRTLGTATNREGFKAATSSVSFLTSPYIGSRNMTDPETHRDGLSTNLRFKMSTHAKLHAKQRCNWLGTCNSNSSGSAMV